MSLSDKIVTKEGLWVIPSPDVRKSIKRLKERGCGDGCKCCFDWRRRIDEEMGEKLIK